MPNKIKTLLTKNSSNEIVIRFTIDDDNKVDLNLQSDDSEGIKNVFLQLANKIKISPIDLEFTISDSIDSKTDGLFIEASQTYIEQLKTEMLSLENDEDLKTIRNSQQSK